MIAALTTGHDIKLVGCDNITSAVIRNLAERVAGGFHKICLIIDSITIEND